MWLDGEPNLNPKSTTRINKNVVKTDKLGSFVNEKGFELVDDIKRTVVGKIQLHDSSFVLLFINSQGISEVGVFNREGSYIRKKALSCFGFNVQCPIHGEFFINEENETIIAWTDNLNPPRYMNLSMKESDITCDNTLMFNYAVPPSIQSSILTSGGSLQSGGYFPFVQYERKDKSVSNIFKLYNPLSIVKDSYGNYPEMDGNDPKEYTSKAIQLIISGINTTYDYINIGIIEVRDGVSTASFIKREPISGSTATYVITGQELKTAISMAELTIDYSLYSKVRHLATVQNELFGTDLTSASEPNLQSEVNSYRIKWLSKLIDPKSPSTFKDGVSRTFAHGEVYAFYIRYHWKTYGIGRWHVFQGRTSNAGETAIVTQPNGTQYYKYQVDDTCSLISTTRGISKGNFSYWENVNETYPTDCGFNGGKVRHFKFPSISWCKKNLYTQNSYGTVLFDTLGIEIEGLNLNSIIDCNGESPVGYEIGFAKRNFDNSTTTGQSITIFHTVKKRGYDKAQRVSMGGNWNIGNVSDPTLDTSDQVRLYPFEYLYGNINPSCNALRLELKLRRGFIDGFAVRHELTSNSKWDEAFYIKADFTEISSQSVAVANEFKTVKDVKIIPANTVATSIDNLLTETCVTAQMDNSSFPAITVQSNGGVYLQRNIRYDEIDKEVEQDVANANYVPSAIYETYLVTLLNVINNCYSNFNQQSVVSMGIATSPQIWNGDTFICDYSINTYGRLTNRVNSKEFNDLNVNGDDEKFDSLLGGVKAIHRFLCESQYNIGLRYENNNQLLGYTKYYPSSQFVSYYNNYLYGFVRNVEPNQFKVGYSKDYNQLNTFQLSPILTPDEFNNFIQNEKYSTIRSRGTAWRNFKQADKFTGISNRGEIINTQGGGNYLYIHYEESLFRTIPRNRRLQTEDETVYLGTSDIFDSTPEEVLHDELGQLGTRHKFSCIFSPLGYTFYDSDKGLWVIVGQQGIKVISDLGLRLFFKRHKECFGDNPYHGYSMQSVYDSKYERLLLSRVFECLCDEDHAKFKGVWKSDLNFQRSLSIGDIVFKDGVYKKIKTINVENTTTNTTTINTTTTQSTTTQSTTTTTTQGTTTQSTTTTQGTTTQGTTTQGTTTQAPINTPVYLFAGASISSGSFQDTVGSFNAMLSAGCNGLQLGVNLWDVFIDSIDAPADFSRIDPLFTYAASTNKVAYVRIALFYARHWNNYLPSENYWGNDIAEVDEWGNKSEQYAGIVQFTKADSAFTDKIADRFKTIVNYLYSKLGNNLMFVSPVTTSTYEAGDEFEGKYWYQNEEGEWMANSYTTTFSYNSKNLPLWHQYLSSIYPNVTALNNSWNSTYGQITDVELPRTGTPYNNGLGHSFNEALSVYAGNKGKDFYMFRDWKNSLFFNKLKTKLTEVSPNIIYSLEFGGFTEGLAPFRCSIMRDTFFNIFKHVKGSSGLIEGCGSISCGYAYLNNSSVQIGDELSSFDLDWCLSDLSSYKLRLKERIASSFNAGHKSFVIFDSIGTVKWETTLQALSELTADPNFLIQKPRISGSTSITQTLREALDNPYGLTNKYIAGGGTQTNVVNINFTI